MLFKNKLCLTKSTLSDYVSREPHPARTLIIVDQPHNVLLEQTRHSFSSPLLQCSYPVSAIVGMVFLLLTTIAGTFGGFFMGKRAGFRKAVSESSVGFE
jgi:hypothetical protein